MPKVVSNVSSPSEPLWVKRHLEPRHVSATSLTGRVRETDAEICRSHSLMSWVWKRWNNSSELLGNTFGIRQIGDDEEGGQPINIGVRPSPIVLSSSNFLGDRRYRTNAIQPGIRVVRLDRVPADAHKAFLAAMPLHDVCRS
jgi:hypothetical protein